jgi:PAS domain S-box-containing protein
VTGFRTFCYTTKKNNKENVKIQAVLNKKAAYTIAAVIAAVALYATNLENYVLFHSMAELFRIVIAAGIFVIAWNTRKFMPNTYLLFIGVAYLYIAFIDLLHTLAYKGMGVFPGADANLPTQLWIAGRYLEAVSLCAAPFFLGKKLRVVPLIIAFLLATALLLLSIHSGAFPDCFIEGRGLTTFKVVSEYAISLILAAAIIYLRKKREYFEKPVLNLLIWSMITTIASEMTFTLYQDVYGFFNLLGHYFKIVSFYLIYAALIQTNLKKPYESLAHEINERKHVGEALQDSEERFRAITYNTPDHILIQDRNLRYTFVVNPQLGLTEADMIGKTDYDFLSGEEADKLTRVKRQVLETGVPHRFETSLISREEKPEFFDGAYVPKFDAHGKIGGLIGYFRNITERKKAEEEIKTINEELIAINQIITAITGVASIKEILEKVLDEALGITGLEGGTICMVTPTNMLHLAAHRATSEATILDLTTNEIKVGDCLCGECARDHKPLILRDREAVLKFATREATRGEDIRFHAAFPLIIGGRCLGVLCVFTRTDNKPEERRLKLLETVIAQIALAVQNAGLFEDSLHNAAMLEEKVKERTAELEEKTAKLERLNRLFVGRELRMKELKERIKELEKEVANHKLQVKKTET